MSVALELPELTPDEAAHSELRTIAGMWLPKVAPR